MQFNMAIHTLSKSERLKSQKQLAALFSDGKSLPAFPLRAVYRIIPKNEASAEPVGGRVLAGFGVSSKNFKHAVDRNRGKRLLREAYRQHQHLLREKLENSSIDLHVFFMMTDKQLPDFATVENKMKYLLRALSKKISASTAQNQEENE